MLQATDIVLPEAAAPTEAQPTEPQSVIDALNRQNARIFKITLVSTVIISLAALVSTYRTFRQLQREDAREEALLRRLDKE